MAEQNKSQGRRRRGHGEGASTQRADGHWVASISLGGLKRKVFYAKTRREAQERLHTALQEQKQGLLIAGPQQPLKQYLKHWLEDIHKARRSPRSYERYKAMIRLHLEPTLGHIMLQKLSPSRYSACSLKNWQRASRQRPSSTSTICCIKPSMTPCAGACWGAMSAMWSRSRKGFRYEIQPLTPEQVRALLVAVKGHQLRAL